MSSRQKVVGELREYRSGKGQDYGNRKRNRRRDIRKKSPASMHRVSILPAIGPPRVTVLPKQVVRKSASDEYGLVTRTEWPVVAKDDACGEFKSGAKVNVDENTE